MLIIPLSPIPSQKLKIVLNDQDCEISVLMRGDNLYLDLTVDGVVIQQGALLLDYVSAIQIPTRNFSGTLAMVDTQGQAAPRYDGLGSRWKLCYWSDGEEGAPRNLVPEFDGAVE
jgi:hypothetical protein